MGERTWPEPHGESGPSAERGCGSWTPGGGESLLFPGLLSQCGQPHLSASCTPREMMWVPFSLERTGMGQRKASIPLQPYLPSIMGLILGGQVLWGQDCLVHSVVPYPAQVMAHSRHLRLIQSLIAAGISWAITTYQVLFSVISMY